MTIKIRGYFDIAKGIVFDAPVVREMGLGYFFVLVRGGSDILMAVIAVRALEILGVSGLW